MVVNLTLVISMQTSNWNQNQAALQLASTVKDAFVVALEEHHDPVSGSSSKTNLSNTDDGKHKSKQAASDEGKRKQAEINDDDGNGDSDDDDDGLSGSEDDADDEGDSRQKPYSKASCRKHCL
jgi:hypothetical protein